MNMTNGGWRPRGQPFAALDTSQLRLFALNASSDIGHGVAEQLGMPLNAHEERGFEDGEHKTRPLDSVEGADVYVVHSLYGAPEESPNDKLCRLLFFVGALKDAGAFRVTTITPYLCYARKDRRTKPQDPVTTRYVAAMFEAAGVDRVIALEVHNPAAFENAFRCPVVALTAAPLIVDYLLQFRGRPLCVVSPDTGGAKRAELVRQTLQEAIGAPVGGAFVEKHRSAGVVSGDILAGNVRDSTAVIVDDLISTGNTLVRAARAARNAGARDVIACATHGLFMAGAEEALADPAISKLIVTDAVRPFWAPTEALLQKLDVLPVAALLAETVRRLQQGRALADLLVF